MHDKTCIEFEDAWIMIGGIPKTGIPFAVQMVREKIGALRVMPTREEIQKLLAIRMQAGA